MSTNIDLIIEDDRWKAFDLISIAARACDAGAARLDLRDLSVSILACNDTRIAALNAEFRDRQKPTNVLSWPSEALASGIAGLPPSRPSDVEIGDIALSFETVMREAEEAGIVSENHITHLILHGFLHLLGYDHELDEDATLMEALEIEALANLGIQNPYDMSA